MSYCVCLGDVVVILTQLVSLPVTVWFHHRFCFPFLLLNVRKMKRVESAAGGWWFLGLDLENIHRY